MTSNRTLLPLVLIAVATLGCHRGDAAAEPSMTSVDAGQSTFPDPMADLTPSPSLPAVPTVQPISEFNGVLTDAGPGLAVEMNDTAGSLGNGYSLKLDSSGNAAISGYKKIPGHSSDRQCVTRKIAPAALAQLTALIRDKDFFSLKNGYIAPTDHGSVQVTITLDGKKMQVGHLASLDSNMVQIDRAERVRLAAIEDGIASLSGARAWLQEKTPITKCNDLGTITPLRPLTPQDYPGRRR